VKKLIKGDDCFESREERGVFGHKGGEDPPSKKKKRITDASETPRKGEVIERERKGGSSVAEVEDGGGELRKKGFSSPIHVKPLEREKEADWRDDAGCSIVTVLRFEVLRGEGEKEKKRQPRHWRERRHPQTSERVRSFLGRSAKKGKQGHFLGKNHF